MTDLRILNSAEVRQALPMAEAIAGMKEAYRQLSAGKADVPLRSRIDLPAQNGVTLFMPAYLAESGDLAVKIVSVFPENVSRSIPIIHATVLILDAETGQPVALLAGGVLTAIRTGAASGAATDLLARPEAKTVAIFGSGVQARTQLEAVCTVRRIQSVRVFSLDLAQADEFAQTMAGQGPIPDRVEVVDNPKAAVTGAEIICTATTSTTPVFAGVDLEPGSHINAIGAFTPQMQEVDEQTILRSAVFVDSRSAVLEEAGDLIIPLQAGLIAENHIQAELGEVALGLKSGRTSPDQITFFKSVGVAVQDAVAGRLALQNAAVQGLGTVLSI